jgi:hypothetical protein
MTVFLVPLIKQKSYFHNGTHIFHNGQPSHGGNRNIFEVMTSTLPTGTLNSGKKTNKKNESRPLIKIKDLNKKWDHAERNHEHYCFLIQKRFKASTVISLNRIE